MNLETVRKGPLSSSHKKPMGVKLETLLINKIDKISKCDTLFFIKSLHFKSSNFGWPALDSAIESKKFDHFSQFIFSTTILESKCSLVLENDFRRYNLWVVITETLKAISSKFI